MSRTYRASGTFDPEDLRMLSGVYHDVCSRIVEDGLTLTTEVRETVAVAIFNLASSGMCDPELLWCRAMREVAARHSEARAAS
jgi:hypothetical protein